MLVTVVIPTYNEARHIRKAIEDLLCDGEPAGRMEVLVADGGSKDGTQEIVRECERAYPGIVRLLDNPGRIQAAGLNVGIRHAQGEFIVRCDAHARYDRGYVRACLKAFEETGADVVGGAQVAIGETYFQKVVAIAYNSLLGSGGSKYRDPSYSGPADTVWLGGYRKAVFADGLRFNEHVSVDEDYELFHLLRGRGCKIHLSADIRAQYLPRRTPWQLMRQFAIHGRSVSLTFSSHPGRILGRPLIMLCAGLAAAGLGAASWFSPTARIVLAAGILAYGLAVVSQALWYVGRRPLWCLVLVPLALTIMHGSYAVGLMYGMAAEVVFGRKGSRAGREDPPRPGSDQGVK